MLNKKYLIKLYLKEIKPNSIKTSSRNIYSKIAKMWDRNKLKCLKTINLSRKVYTFRSPNSITKQNLISGSWDKTIKQWDIEEASFKRTLTGHTGFVSAVKLISNQQIATGSWDHSLRIWDLKNGSCLKTLHGHESKIMCLEKLTKKLIHILLSGSEDGAVKLWNVKTGKCIKTLEAHKGAVLSLNTTNAKLYSCSSDDTIKIWNLETLNCTKTLDLASGVFNIAGTPS